MWSYRSQHRPADSFIRVVPDCAYDLEDVTKNGRATLHDELLYVYDGADGIHVFDGYPGLGDHPVLRKRGTPDDEGSRLPLLYWFVSSKPNGMTGTSGFMCSSLEAAGYLAKTSTLIGTFSQAGVKLGSVELYEIDDTQLPFTSCLYVGYLGTSPMELHRAKSGTQHGCIQPVFLYDGKTLCIHDTDKAYTQTVSSMSDHGRGPIPDITYVAGWNGDPHSISLMDSTGACIRFGIGATKLPCGQYYMGRFNGTDPFGFCEPRGLGPIFANKKGEISIIGSRNMSSGMLMMRPKHDLVRIGCFFIEKKNRDDDVLCVVATDDTGKTLTYFFDDLNGKATENRVTNKRFCPANLAVNLYEDDSSKDCMIYTAGGGFVNAHKAILYLGKQCGLAYDNSLKWGGKSSFFKDIGVDKSDAECIIRYLYRGDFCDDFHADFSMERMIKLMRSAQECSLFTLKCYIEHNLVKGGYVLKATREEANQLIELSAGVRPHARTRLLRLDGEFDPPKREEGEEEEEDEDDGNLSGNTCPTCGYDHETGLDEEDRNRLELIKEEEEKNKQENKTESKTT